MYMSNSYSRRLALCSNVDMVQVVAAVQIGEDILAKLRDWYNHVHIIAYVHVHVKQLFSAPGSMLQCGHGSGGGGSSPERRQDPGGTAHAPAIASAEVGVPRRQGGARREPGTGAGARTGGEPRHLRRLWRADDPLSLYLSRERPDRAHLLPHSPVLRRAAKPHLSRPALASQERTRRPGFRGRRQGIYPRHLY